MVAVVDRLPVALDGYGYVSTAWDYPQDYTSDLTVWEDQDDDGSYAVSSGITKTSYDSITDPTRPRPFGYRWFATALQ